jgi:putative DNA primase/helicase
MINLIENRVNSVALTEWVEESGIDEGLALANLEEPGRGSNALWECSAVDIGSGRKQNRGQRKYDSKTKYKSFPANRDTDIMPLALTLDTVKKLVVENGGNWTAFCDEYLDPRRDDLGFYRYLLGNQMPDARIVITEGFKKAGAVITHGGIAFPLPGVWNWSADGGEDFKPMLKTLLEMGKPIYLAFDSDSKRKPLVHKALTSFAKLGENLYTGIAGIMDWNESEGKGIDDYMLNRTRADLERLFAGALTPQAFVETYPEPVGKGKDKPDPVAIAREIAADSRDEWAYNAGSEQWMTYKADKGIWVPITQSVMSSWASSVLHARNVPYKNQAFVNNVIAEMQNALLITEWGERSDLLPFEDCVVSLETGKRLLHSPGWRITWQLPRKYPVEVGTWTSIDGFLKEATGGDEKAYNKLIAFAAATLRGMPGLQKFIHLIGQGGTGKSTYLNLLSELIGSKNVWSGTVDDLNDKTVRASLEFIRLILLPDQDKSPKAVEEFKKYVGRDPVSGRALYQNPKTYRFTGQVAMGSNQPVFNKGLGRWFTRRTIMVSFTRPPAQKRDLEREFEPEYAAFTQYLLSLSEGWIKSTLDGEGSDNLTPATWSAMCRPCSVAAWIEEHVYPMKGAKLAIGNNQRQWSSAEDYNPLASEAYGSYALFCKGEGRSLEQRDNFADRAFEMMTSVLGWKVERKKIRIGTQTVNGFVGIGLRWDGCPELHPSEVLAMSECSTHVPAVFHPESPVVTDVPPVPAYFTEQNNNLLPATDSVSIGKEEKFTGTPGTLVTADVPSQNLDGTLTEHIPAQATEVEDSPASAGTPPTSTQPKRGKPPVKGKQARYIGNDPEWVEKFGDRTVRVDGTDKDGTVRGYLTGGHLVSGIPLADLELA